MQRQNTIDADTREPAVPLPEAFAHCADLTRAHYENFPVGSFLIPKPIRPHVYSIYAFARTADDFADEPGLEPDERLHRLDDWSERLDTCLTTPRGPIFTALSETIRTQQLPIRWLKDLLKAFRMDVTTHRHATHEDLLTYCTYSANPVGRLILHLFGHRDETLGRHSDAICTALQLANFWQDIAVDFSRNRIYIPQADMRQFGVSEADLAAGCANDAFRSLLTCQIARARAMFIQGLPLLDAVRGRLKYELRLTWLGGMGILRLIEKNDYDVFNRHPKITGWIGLKLLLKSLLPGSIA